MNTNKAFQKKSSPLYSKKYDKHKWNLQNFIQEEIDMM